MSTHTFNGKTNFWHLKNYKKNASLIKVRQHTHTLPQFTVSDTYIVKVNALTAHMQEFLLIKGSMEGKEGGGRCRRGEKTNQYSPP